ncbi:MAG: ribonuclease HII [Actinobacteria bacterium]|nr:ribonuclease HII [Actinomycetota bacterium]
MRKSLRGRAPSLGVERELWGAGDTIVVGVDEVGRGAWAGPLVVGAAVAPKDRRPSGIRDSKMLTEAEREAAFERVAQWCEAWSLGVVTHEECDALGMSAALKLAARRALEALSVAPDRVLLDGSWDFIGGGITRTIVKGDATCTSIAAASILAKVSRDRMMRIEAENFPGYEFHANKGYPCPRHRMAIAANGPTTIHRRSWSFMDGLPWSGVSRTPAFDEAPTLF